MKKKETTSRLPSKEALTVDLAKIRQSHEEWVAGDLKRRREFARAFGWNKPKRQYDYGDAELYEPTWIEIFVELGKLLGARNFMDYEGNISELEVKVENMARNWEKYFKEKQN